MIYVIHSSTPRNPRSNISVSCHKSNYYQRISTLPTWTSHDMSNENLWSFKEEAQRWSLTKLSLSLSLSLSHVISKLFVFVVLYEVWRVRAFTAVELKSYNAILAPSIYQKRLAAVEVKQKFFADLLQCTSIYRCAL